MAHDEPRFLTMEIDGRTVTVPEGLTVLRAAEINGILIPSLCSHRDLSPFGGCRLCMVEIEGMRGYPLSCTTAAEDGMRVRTDTEALREFRREMLKLILSEHPSSCLLCGESEACRSYQGTIRKAGVTTGCRFCPNDDQCELQDVIDRIGMPEMDYPVLYHGFEPEHDDPFYDRDYNICILCGRCVRMCQEVRGTSVLAFTLRGSQTKVGPAFGRSHIEAGCEFCGACVDVCPTGALADKASKWEGRADGSRVSTCPICAIGCQLELQHKSGRLIRVKAYADSEVNDGQLCVKGRFGLLETTHHFERGLKPMVKKGPFFREVTWDEALERAAGALREAGPEGSAMLVSPDLTNESLFAAQKLVREGWGSANIDSTGRWELAGGLGLWRELFSLPVSLRDLLRAEAIVVVGLDTRFDFSVVGTRIRRAVGSGARLIVIDPRDSNLAKATDDWLRPAPGREGLVLRALAEAAAGDGRTAARVIEGTGVETAVFKRAAEALASSRRLSLALGPQAFHYSDTADLIEGIRSLAGRDGTNVVPLYFGANARGALELGAYAEVLPGGLESERRGFGLRDIVTKTWRPKVLYLVGEVPFLDRPDCDVLIVQDTYLPPFEVDVFLPAASFAEAGGSLVNVEGRVQEVVQIESPPEGARTGFVRPDWRIFSDLAAAMGCRTMDYQTPQDVFQDIRRAIPGFPTGISRRPRRMAPPPAREPMGPGPAESGRRGTHLLVALPGAYRHRGIDMASKVEGLHELGLEEGLRMHPDDLKALGLRDGGAVAISWNGGEVRVRGPVRADEEAPRGVVYFTRPAVWGGLEGRRDLQPLLGVKTNPAWVEVRAGGD